jgi:hypothetical protein
VSTDCTDYTDYTEGAWRGGRLGPLRRRESVRVQTQAEACGYEERLWVGMVVGNMSGAPRKRSGRRYKGFGVRAEAIFCDFEGLNRLWALF